MARSTTPLGSARRRAGPCALAPAPTAARGGRAAACRRAEGAPAAALPAEEAVAAVARRGVLRGGGLGGLGAALGAAATFPAAEARAAGAPKGFNVVKNPTKGYGTRRRRRRWGRGTRRAGAAALLPWQEDAAED